MRVSVGCKARRWMWCMRKPSWPCGRQRPTWVAMHPDMVGPVKGSVEWGVDSRWVGVSRARARQGSGREWFTLICAGWVPHSDAFVRGRAAVYERASERLSPLRPSWVQRGFPCRSATAAALDRSRLRVSGGNRRCINRRPLLLDQRRGEGDQRCASVPEGVRGKGTGGPAGPFPPATDLTAKQLVHP